MSQYNFNDDCPVFEGLFDFCRYALQCIPVLHALARLRVSVNGTLVGVWLIFGVCHTWTGHAGFTLVRPCKQLLT